MTDVLEIALERRDQLQREINRLDDFVRTAEQLIRGAGTPSRPASEETAQTGSHRINLLRRGGNAA